MGLSRVFLYFNTARYLRPRQFIYNLLRRSVDYRVEALETQVSARRLDLIAPIKYEGKINGEGLCFLNQCRGFDVIRDWHCPQEPKLWRYNLHYFDYLLDDGVDNSIKDELIDQWIAVAPGISEDACEPYPVSLRLVNWIKYFVIYKNNSVPQKWIESLYQQARLLASSIEYHILANHYLKNGKGLLYAGAFLDGPEADKWYELGCQIMLEEAGEQLLADGGHYEKSPMYHAIVVEDYLDVVNLIQSNKLNIKSEQLDFMVHRSRDSLDFLQAMLMPDGDISLFNDAAFGITPKPRLIFDYGERVLGYRPEEELDEVYIRSLDSSGYYLISDSDSKCIVDCGRVFPEYQPGHTHCDLLSYELTIAGKRLVVDAGVHDYERSEARQYCRSTRAHNTVMIDGREQSEIWGQFRVARRARVVDARLEKSQGCWEFNGSYQPYHGALKHARRIHYDGRVWSISDEVTGKGRHKVENFIHICPDVEVSRQGDSFIMAYKGESIAKLTVHNHAKVELDQGWYYPEFGISRKNTVIIITGMGALPIRQAYQIEALANL